MGNLNPLNLLNKEAWNAYQEDYFTFHLMERPDYFEFFSGGGVDLDEHLAPMLGDVKGMKLLDTCCACDAAQAFSWHNLGAVVTACDITEKAIEIAAKNAAKMNLAVSFAVADMQTLEPIGDGGYDVVFATYPVWVQNIEEACRTWYRVLMNAVCGAGFVVAKVHESAVSNPTDMNLDYEPKDSSEAMEMKNLPSEFTVLAVK